MSNPEAVRNQSAQTAGRRAYEARRVNYDEHPQANYRTPAHVDYIAADTTTEALATWSDPIAVDAYERLHMFLRHTPGIDTTAVHVAVQCSTFKASHLSEIATAAELEWYDFHEDIDNNGTMTRHTYDFAWLTAAGNARIMFKLPRLGRYMRFKVWTDGTNRANSRIALYAMRVMEAA